MQLRKVIATLSENKSSIYVFRRGKSTKHAHAALAQDVAQASAALKSWGIGPGIRVGVYAPNSYEWVVYDLALIELGAISVAFTDDFAGGIGDELLERYGIALLLISKSEANLYPDRPRHVAFMDGENDAVRALDRVISEDDQADQHSLVFSSGSAGGLKGLVISRKGVDATLPPIVEAIGVGPEDRLMLFLPISNFQQRNMYYTALWIDCDIIITDFTQLAAAMQALSPTILIAPPIYYQMVYAEHHQLHGRSGRFLGALGALVSLLPDAPIRRALGRILYADFYRQFGGRMRLLVTGMAPIRPSIAKFFARTQLALCETYGLVEAGSITYRDSSSRQHASVGKVLAGMNLSFTEEGEIIISRESPLTLRYFQCSEGENERTFIGSGRIATGDLGRLDADGNLFLLGRKKEVIVTPGGYKIHPEIIEKELNTSPDIAQSVVFLRPGASNLTCVVALNAPIDKDTKLRVLQYVKKLKTGRKASPFMEVVFAEEHFSKDNGMLRPNLKIDRKRIVEKYGSGNPVL